MFNQHLPTITRILTFPKCSGAGIPVPPEKEKNQTDSFRKVFISNGSSLRLGRGSARAWHLERLLELVFFRLHQYIGMAQQHIRHKSIFVVWIYQQLFIFGFHNKYQLSLQIHLEVFTKKLLNLKFNQSEQNGGIKVLTFHIYNFSHHQRPKVLYKWKV